jgi:hypothetical protein
VAQKAGQRFSYFNFDDYALRTAGFGSWEWDNSTRPDDVFADYHYDEGDGIIDTYINSTGDRFRHGQQTLLFPANEFEIYSYAAQARSRALGVLSGITGFSSFNLHDAPLSYNGAHYCHSRQFRSDIVDEQAYWSHVMSDCGFNP